MCNIIESAAGPQLFAVCFSYGGELRNACSGGGASVAVGGIKVGMISGIDVIAIVGVTILVGFGIAVGTLPTGWITFFTYVLATSNRHERRLLIAGIRNSKMASINEPAPAIKIFLFDMKKSVPEQDESKLIHT